MLDALTTSRTTLDAIPDAHPDQWAAMFAAIDTQPDADLLRAILTPEHTHSDAPSRRRALPTHGWSARR